MGLLRLSWLIMVLLATFLYKRLIFIPKLLKILQSVNKRPPFCVIRYVFKITAHLTFEDTISMSLALSMFVLGVQY